MTKRIPTERATVAASGPVLAARELSAGYGDLAAVRSLSFEVHPGEVVALFGANGAGKTTTLLAMSGVLPRMGGHVEWRGSRRARPLHKMAREGLGLVPGAPTVITRLSTRDNLRLGRGGVSAAVAYFPELEGLLDRRAGLLSGGEQQMLAMARALAAKPTVILVDEVSLGLAPLIVERLLGALRAAADQEGLAVILVEQQARRALAVSDRWHLLVNGVITHSGTRADGHLLEAAYRAGLDAKPSEQSA